MTCSQTLVIIRPSVDGTVVTLGTEILFGALSSNDYIGTSDFSAIGMVSSSTLVTVMVSFVILFIS